MGSDRDDLWEDNTNYCKVCEQLKCINCMICKKDKTLNLKDYVWKLINDDIECSRDQLQIFTVLTHTTQKQQESAYNWIFKIQRTEKLRDEFANLMKDYTNGR
jgi:hypothetical protein